MKKILLISIAFLSTLFFAPIYSQQNIEPRVDSTLHPLYNKKYGIEINPIFLIMSVKEETMVSGTFSFFGITRKGEIAILFDYLKTIKVDPDYADPEEITVSIDAMFRKFLNGTQGGLYFSSGLRYNYRYEPEDHYWPNDVHYETTNKVGISFGIGYRYFSHSGLYWGASFFGGKYFTGIDNSKKKVGDNSPQFIGGEFLKFGYAF